MENIYFYLGVKRVVTRLAVQFLLHHFFGMGQCLVAVEGQLQRGKHRWLVVVFGAIQTDTGGDFGGAGLATHGVREARTAHIQVRHGFHQTQHVARLVAGNGEKNK